MFEEKRRGAGKTRAGTGAFPMNPGFAAHVWKADQRIAKLTGLGLAEAAARFHAPDDELSSTNHARIQAGQAEMRRFGARGVPTLVAGKSQGRRVVSSSALYRDAGQRGMNWTTTLGLPGSGALCRTFYPQHGKHPCSPGAERLMLLFFQQGSAK